MIRAGFLSFTHMPYTAFQQSLHGTEMARENADTFPFHGSRKDRRSCTQLAEHILCRNFTIDKGEFRHGRSAQPHLVQLLAHRESRCAFIDDKSGNASGAFSGIDIREYDYD